MLVLTASDIERVYDLDLAFRGVEEAARGMSDGALGAPPRSAFHGERAEILAMPAGGLGAASVKMWYALDEPRGTLPITSAAILLIDPALGAEVVMDGGIVTDLRTGAISGLAASRLAPSHSRTLGVIGAGVQARTQIHAILHALPDIDRVLVHSRSQHKRESFVELVREQAEGMRPGRRISFGAMASAEVLAGESDVLVLATTSRVPVIEPQWFGGGLIIGVGSHDAGSAEIPSELIEAASTVAVDTRAGAIDGAGDLLPAIAAGRLRREEVLELGELLASGERRPAPAVFKSVGFAAADLVAARMIARRAMETGAGFEVDLHL